MVCCLKSCFFWLNIVVKFDYSLGEKGLENSLNFYLQDLYKPCLFIQGLNKNSMTTKFYHLYGHKNLLELLKFKTKTGRILPSFLNVN